MGAWWAGSRVGANQERWSTFDPFHGEDEPRTFFYEITRDQLLAYADVRTFERVLDLGAGSGLLTRQVCQRAYRDEDDAGRVVALDRSLPALRACRAEIGEPDEHFAPLLPVVADASHLPFAANTFHVALVHSVLRYLPNHPYMLQELHRVLCWGGRVVACEPLWRERTDPREDKIWDDVVDMAPFQPDHDRIVAYLRQHTLAAAPERSEVQAFEERDLMRYFIAAGFRDVEVNSRYRYSRHGYNTAKAVVRQVQDTPGYACAALAVLGSAAQAYLSRLAAVLSAVPSPLAYAVAYVLAGC